MKFKALGPSVDMLVTCKSTRQALTWSPESQKERPVPHLEGLPKKHASYSLVFLLKYIKIAVGAGCKVLKRHVLTSRVCLICAVFNSPLCVSACAAVGASYRIFLHGGHIGERPHLWMLQKTRQPTAWLLPQRRPEPQLWSDRGTASVTRPL